MREIGVLEAKNTLGALLDAVERGEQITIMRQGRAIARLVPTDAVLDQGKAQAAVQQMHTLRRGVSLGGIPIADLINEGRR